MYLLTHIKLAHEISHLMFIYVKRFVELRVCAIFNIVGQLLIKDKNSLCCENIICPPDFEEYVARERERSEVRSYDIGGCC